MYQGSSINECVPLCYFGITHIALLSLATISHPVIYQIFPFLLPTCRPRYFRFISRIYLSLFFTIVIFIAHSSNRRKFKTVRFFFRENFFFLE